MQVSYFSTNISFHRVLSTMRPSRVVNRVPPDRYGTVEFTSHSTHYRSFWRRFYGSDDPTNSV